MAKGKKINSPGLQRPVMNLPQDCSPRACAVQDAVRAASLQIPWRENSCSYSKLKTLPIPLKSTKPEGLIVA
jgi:hypothetical protein